MEPKALKLAYLDYRVIQYKGPLFKKIASQPGVELKVLYCSKEGSEAYKDLEFNKEISWGQDLLSGYQYTFLKNYSPFQRGEHFFRYLNFGIINELRREKYDAIIIWGYGWFMSWFAWLVANLLRTPVIFHGETNLLRFKHHGSLRKLIKKPILKLFFAGCKAFLSIGSLNKDYYSYFGVNKKIIFDCPYAVNNDFFMTAFELHKTPQEQEKIRKEFKIPENKLILLFAGKLIQKKRPLDLLQSYRLMKTKDQCVLVFAGDGPLRDELIQCLTKEENKSVRFLGFLDQKEITKVYSCCDIFIFPSDFEPFGLALNEVMCFAKPVISSSEISAAHDLVKDNGFIYPAGDIEKLAFHLDQLASSKEQREKMGALSKEIISNWNYESDVKGIISALEFVRC